MIFQRVSRLGSVTARQSSSGRQPNFAALNRGRHLCSAGRTSCWELAHILVYYCFYSDFMLLWTTGGHCHQGSFCKSTLNLCNDSGVTQINLLSYWLQVCPSFKFNCYYGLFMMSRAEAVSIANALIALTVAASLGDLSSLSELVSSVV